MKDYFEILYKEALKASKKEEIPVGAIIVKDNKVIAKSHNNRQKKYNVLGHAEINCIIKASKKLKDWRLDGCTMYVTLEPCDMCKTIIVESRIDKVFYLLSKNNKNRNKITNTRFIQTNVQNNNLIKYQKLLKNFFDKLRD